MRPMYNGYIIADSSYLSHHGILGMKWGKMNGPPYPLGSGDHSKAEKKAGWRKSLGPGRNEELYGKKNNAKVQNGSKKTNKKTEPKSEHKGLTNGQKTAIKVAGVAIAAVGVAYLYKSGKLDGVIDAGKSQAGKLLGNAGDTPLSDVSYTVKTEAPKIKSARVTDMAKKLSEQTGFKLKNVGMNKADDGAAINPKYGEDKWSTRENCGYASMGWCLRRMGLDVKIKDSFQGSAFIPSNITEFFSNAKFPHIISERNEIDASSVEAVKSSLVKAITNKYKPTDGHCGMIGLLPNTSDHGHFMAWEMNKGVIEFFDPQSHGKVSPDHYLKYVVDGTYKKTDIAYTDLTDAIPKAEIMKEIFE